MKAIVFTKYGPPEVLQLKDVPKPIPKENEILIKNYAATVNRTDCAFRDPDPFFVRFFSGLIKPKRPILGSEFAGEVEALGKEVKLFKKGDQVFGLTGISFGAHAEYLCLPEEGSIAIKPANLTYDEAASVCDGAMLAQNCLKEINFRQGIKLLINGTTGSIGNAALQLAKYYGAEVTAVCNTKNIDLIKSFGADRVVDYLKEDFTKDDQTYDVVLDAVGKSSFSRCKRLLKQDGLYISTDLGFLYQNIFYALWTRKFGRKKILFPIPKENPQQIAFFKELLETGKLKTVIDRRYPLEQIAEAYRYVEKGEKTGNVVINVHHK